MRTILSFILICSLCFTISAHKIVVGQGGAYTSVEQAINTSRSGDTVLVKKGLYKEGNIKVDKPITFYGEKGAVLDGGGHNEVVTITANDVKIAGFIIQNTGESNLKDLAGICLKKVRNCTVSNNHLNHTCFGIRLDDAKNCRVINNTLKGDAKDEVASGGGIYLWHCDSCFIKGNTINRHRDGIYFEFVTNTRIVSNVGKNNIRYGLHFMFSNHDNYEENIFENNAAGVAVMYSKYITMNHNLFKNNWGDASYGLLLKEIYNSDISHNVFLKNTTGIYMESCSNNKLFKNTLQNNGWALKIMSDCTCDTLTTNNIVGNSFDVSTSGSTNANYFNKNFWDKYRGYDLNHDNIGDIPYHPVSLFSMIVDASPSSIVLLRSFMIDVLNEAEKIMPAFTPKSLVDSNPLMHEVK